jgi:peroxiredoxin
MREERHGYMAMRRVVMDKTDLCDRASDWKRGRGILSGVAVAVLLAAGTAKSVCGNEGKGMDRQAPEFAGIARWINGDVIKLANLQGKVIVLHFWTFGCINCQRNLPLYNRWYADFTKSDVQIIGVHTPETNGEGELESVTANVQKLGIKYPVAVDNERATWDAYGNRYWPSVYLIDKRGQVRYRWDGELESGGQHGDAVIRGKVRELLAEKVD